MRRRYAPYLAYLFCLGGVTLLAAWVAFGVGMDRLEERGKTDLDLSSDRLVAYLRRYREIAVVLAEHPDLRRAVSNQTPATETNVEAILQDVADKSGASALILFDRTRGTVGQVGEYLASADMSQALKRALNGALGSERVVQGQNRQFIYVAPIFNQSGPAAGAVGIAVDASKIEWNWPNDPIAVFFSEPSGNVFVSNRSDLVLRERPGVPGAAAPPVQGYALGGHDVWFLDAGPYLPSIALHVTRQVEVLGLQADALIDAAPAVRTAIWQAAGAGGLGLAIGALFFLASERRRDLAFRLEQEELSNLALDARVRARTAELSRTNEALRKEIEERQEAEAALRRAQAELVQAGKLSALGKMSAGISHELNQPLTAIRSFAENANAFLDKGQPERATENLNRISEMARRMGRIIKNLRAFARQEHEALTDVSINAVIDIVLELSANRIADEGVTLIWEPSEDVVVRGGEVRLQQVLTNLVSNALDAMQSSKKKELRILVETLGPKVRVAVQDTGPGIVDPERIFDPFYSTKDVGSANGMGLGLSISYGIVQSFGGVIRGRNLPSGGAEISIELTVSQSQVAA